MPLNSDIDRQLLKKLVRRKRGQDSLRKAAKDIGVSAPTLQRIEGGQVPTSDVLVGIAEWLGVSLDELRKTKPARQNRSTVDQIEVHLRADPNLDEEAADTIANVVKQIYDGFTKKNQ
ncbi:MAG: helix-turn-helix transcriptional regulator [Planctomycetota bacterium]